MPQILLAETSAVDEFDVNINNGTTTRSRSGSASAVVPGIPSLIVGPYPVPMKVHVFLTIMGIMVGGGASRVHLRYGGVAHVQGLYFDVQHWQIQKHYYQYDLAAGTTRQIDAVWSGGNNGSSYLEITNNTTDETYPTTIKGFVVAA